MRSAARPTGRRSVSTVRFGIDAVVVRPYDRRPSPATKSPISIAASVSPCASESGLPVSAATSSLASSRRSLRSSAIARTTFPRSTAVRAAHSGWAAAAAVTAASASSTPERATRQSGAPSAGRSFSSQVPLAGGRSLPATRFGTCAGITRPTSPRRRRGSRPSRTTTRPRRGRRRRRRPRTRPSAVPRANAWQTPPRRAPAGRSRSRAA